jgi:hypothetical protein
MGTGIQDDLKARMKSAHENGTCFVPQSDSEAHRLRRALLRKDVISPAPQVYALPDLWHQLDPLQRERFRTKALARLHPTWTFADVSAAALHGLSISYGLLGRVHLACERNRRARNTKDYIRHTMSGIETAIIDGVRVTTLERTVFDCTRRYAFPDALAIADSALRLSGAHHETFMSFFSAQHARNSNRWRAIETMALADARAESGGESIARAAMIRHGYMIPQLQKTVPNPLDCRAEYRIDFFWNLESGCVAGEMDGREKYYNPKMTSGRNAVTVMADERVRESLVSSYGYRMVRFSYRDIRNPQAFCRLMDLFDIPKGYSVPRVALA